MTLDTFDNVVSTLLRDINKHAIGFEPAFRRLSPLPSIVDNKYPPFDLEKVTDTQFKITMAVAGFKLEDMEILVADNVLSITGKLPDSGSRQYIHNGIAKRDFARNFVLADYVNVTSASLSDGILTIDLIYELPESEKPRKIAINDNIMIGNSKSDEKALT